MKNNPYLGHAKVPYRVKEKVKSKIRKKHRVYGMQKYKLGQF